MTEDEKVKTSQHHSHRGTVQEDTPENDPLGSKKEQRHIAIHVPDKHFVDFLLRLHHETVSMRRFFKIVVEGWATNDPRITSFVDEKVAAIRSKYKSRFLDRERKKTKEMERKFGLNKHEIQDIYDIIEEDLEI